MHIMNRLTSCQTMQKAQASGNSMSDTQEQQVTLVYSQSRVSDCAHSVDAFITKDQNILKESAHFSEPVINLSAHFQKSVHLVSRTEHLLKTEQSTVHSLSNSVEGRDASELSQNMHTSIESIPTPITDHHTPIEDNYTSVENTPISIESTSTSSHLNCSSQSDRRCPTLIDLYHAIDKTMLGRAAINIGHITVRNLAAVLLPTAVRQVVGHFANQAMYYGLNETARTALGMTFMMVPVAGQLILGVKDELEAKATNYSRATRAVTIGLSLATGGASIVTQTMINSGMRFAEAILYPLVRDSVQAAIPIMSNPESGPTKKSLFATGTAYAFNQLGVSRAFVAFPSSVQQKNDQQYLLSFKGVACQSTANAVGEALDLYTLCMFNHIARNGIRAEQPQLRMERSNLLPAYRNRVFWDTVFARGSFVSAFNQFYDSMLASGPLTEALDGVLGKDNGHIAVDWATEAVAVLLTMATYPFWTDPLHTRGVDFSQASKLEAGNRDTSVQQHREPGLPDSFAARQETVHVLSMRR